MMETTLIGTHHSLAHQRLNKLRMALRGAETYMIDGKGETTLNHRTTSKLRL